MEKLCCRSADGFLDVCLLSIMEAIRRIDELHYLCAKQSVDRKASRGYKPRPRGGFEAKPSWASRQSSSLYRFIMISRMGPSCP